MNKMRILANRNNFKEPNKDSGAEKDKTELKIHLTCPGSLINMSLKSIFPGGTNQLKK